MKRRVAATALAGALHPRLGSESPAGLLSQWLVRNIASLAYGSPDRVVVANLLLSVPYVVGEWYIHVEDDAVYVISVRRDACFRFKPVSNGWFDVQTSVGSWSTVWSSRYDDESVLPRSAPGTFDLPPLTWPEATPLDQGSRYSAGTLTLDVCAEDAVKVHMNGFDETIEFRPNGQVTFRGEATRARLTNVNYTMLTLMEGFGPATAADARNSRQQEGGESGAAAVAAAASTSEAAAAASSSEGGEEAPAEAPAAAGPQDMETDDVAQPTQEVQPAVRDTTPTNRCAVQ